MTDEELAAIKERAKKFDNLSTEGATEWLATAMDSATDIPALVAEAEQLKTELFDKAGPEWAKEYTAARKAEAEVVRLQRTINQVRELANDVDKSSAYLAADTIAMSTDLFAIIDGEEQS